MIWQRHRCVAYLCREHLDQERRDRPVHHGDVEHHDHQDQLGHEPVDLGLVGCCRIAGGLERGRPFGIVPALDFGRPDGHIDRLRPRHAQDLEREPRLGEEVLSAVALREVGPGSHEDVEVTGRLVSRYGDRILVREGFKVRVDIVRQPFEQRNERDRCDQAARQDDLQPSDAVRQPAEHDEERRADHKRERNQGIGRDVVELERDGEEEQRIELACVPNHALAGGRAEQREQHVFVVRVVQEALGQRRLRAFALFLHLRKDRRFVQAQPDPDRDAEQEHRHQERNSPAPFGEHLGVHVDAAEPDHQQRHEEAERRRGLNVACRIATLVRPRVLGHIGRRAAVFAAEREALGEAQRHEQEGGGPADRLECGQQADQEGRAAHHHDGDEEGIFASDQIADAAENDRAERAHQEARRIGREGRQ